MPRRSLERSSAGSAGHPVAMSDPTPAARARATARSAAAGESGTSCPVDPGANPVLSGAASRPTIR